MSQPVEIERQNPLRLMAVLCALMGFASISTDFYLPAMPTMARAFHVGPGAMEWTIAAYLVGFSSGQLFWGPAGDRFGRKRPIAIGLVLFVIGSAGCAMAGSAAAVIGWRMVQAVGACAGVVLSRAMVRDLYGPEKSGQMLSTLITVMAIAPLVGPLLGGQILLWAGWRAIFWLLVAVGILTGIGLATILETLPVERRSQAGLMQAFGDYRRLAVDRRVLSCALIGGFYYVGVYAYVAGSPLAFITYHHVPAQGFGVVFGLGILGIMAANMANVRLLPLYGGWALMRWGVGLAAASGLGMAIVAATDWGGMVALALCCFVFVAASGLIVANSMARAMAQHPRHAGSVSAMMGAAQYGSGMVGSALISFFADGTPRPMALTIAFGGIAAYACLGLNGKERKHGG
ncbi:multidrug effflux MFS transporter [Novosphingobium sediminicola]|uniref:Bcr/CflA family efflux transporter n=1 Tax=Novosphingobium sediminicola TaxID=563162 RepID=A0A7W6G881_9SPHN|nr:DHA1 family bicyclomycin/chloramphenicol resistance-like MFS transporter [Novosphingobium sediminicola]